MSADEEELLDRLRAVAAEADAPPAYVTEAARAAFATRNLGAELAALLADSETDSPVLTRGQPSAVRMLSFAAGEVLVELQVTAAHQSVAMRGFVQHAAGPVVVETLSGSQTVEPDEDGWFTLDRVPAGMCRLRLHSATGADVTTEWVDL